MKTLNCKWCGERPVEEFTYVYNVSHFFRLSPNRADGTITAHEVSTSDYDGKRIFHDRCMAHVRELPEIVIGTQKSLWEVPA